MADQDFPLLLFPDPTSADRNPGGGGGTPFVRPSVGRQRARINPKLLALSQAFAARRLALQQVAPAENPELVLVLETIGSIDNFARAVARVPGLEWLFEWVQDDVAPDADFYVDGKPGKSLSGRLFMLATNEAALNQLLSLWNRYQNDPEAKFDQGLAPFRHLFAQLKDIRHWSVADRISADVRTYWEDRLQDDLAAIRFEIEAWYFSSPQKNDSARAEIAARVAALNGAILHRALIPEIAYHGFLVELPSAAVAAVLAGDTPELILSDRIMFFRPKAQSLTVSVDAPELLTLEAEPGASAGSPIVALLDGLPLQNHPLLAGRLEIDDPDGWEEAYEAKDRVHGTSMASLIVHGELDGGGSPLTRRVYVRPIMRPDPTDTFNARRREHTPPDTLLIDLVHRAVRRIFVGEAGQPAVAPSIRVINLSIGDDARMFDREMSPWARLVDWLSFTYRVLFVVSAGNDGAPLILNVPAGGLAAMNPELRSAQALQGLIANGAERRIVAPAESINAITVGASHSDQCELPIPPNRFDLFGLGGVSSISRVGHGFRRAIKPDILLPGGRALHREQIHANQQETVLETVGSATPPGHKVAAPPMPGGPLNVVAYCRGTSNSAALASRSAAIAFEIIDQLRTGAEASLPEAHDAVVLKALLAHGAGWGPWASVLLASRPDLTDWMAQKDFVTRWLGYGPADVDRTLACTAERATMIGTGELSAEQAYIFSAPLPPSLAGKTVWRRLTVTLAWLTPINPAHRAYRRAKLWITPPQAQLLVKRANSVHDKAAQRGTLQHEVLEGDAAVAFVDGDRFECKVNCAADAGELTESVPFALCVTLEVANGAEIPIYQEIRDRIVPQIPIQPGAT
jgi:Subtilase family